MDFKTLFSNSLAGRRLLAGAMFAFGFSALGAAATVILDTGNSSCSGPETNNNLVIAGLETCAGEDLTELYKSNVEAWMKKRSQTITTQISRPTSILRMRWSLM